MKYIALVLAAGLAAGLAACGDTSDNVGSVDPEKATSAATVAPAVAAYDGGPLLGTYHATNANGTVLEQTLRDDGTVLTQEEDGTERVSSYTIAGDTFCITPEGETEGDCYDYSDLAEDSSWTATNDSDPDDVWTINRVLAQ